MANLDREHIDHKEVIDVLEDLIQTNRNGQNGYRDAAEHVTDSELRAFFNEQSLERARFAGQLEDEAIRLGKHDVERKGSTSAAIHRAWIDLKANMGGGEHSILSSVESGEDNAKKQYEEALRRKLPEDLQGIIHQQAQSIFAAHDQVKLLRDRRKAA
jgi:uncharacterized protein (TIGR02284 family)